MLTIFVVVFLLMFPMWDIVELRNLKRRPDRKLGFYWRAIIVLWTAAGLAAWFFGATTFWSAPVYFVHWSDGVARLLAILFSVVLLVAMMVPLCLALYREQLGAAVSKGAEAFAYLLPATALEQFTFALVSMTAGICEEWVFRGMLLHILPQLIPNLDGAVAIVVTSALFGLGHAGQGWKGMMVTATLGGVFALLYVTSGTLLLPIIVHACIDLRAILIARLRNAYVNRRAAGAKAN